MNHLLKTTSSVTMTSHLVGKRTQRSRITQRARKWRSARRAITMSMRNPRSLGDYESGSPTVEIPME
jgi:hypothetical protein